MFKSISSKSAATTVPELDLFSIPDTSVGVLSTRYVECPLTNSISNSSNATPGPIEWRYNIQRGFLNLQRSYVQFTIGIRDKDGKIITVAPGEELPIVFTQFIGKTLFKQFQCYLNGVLIEDSSPLYAWRAIIENELSFDSATKETNHSLGGYAFDDPVGDPKASGYKRRMNWLNKNGEGQFAATLNLNLFNQPRLLLNYMDLKIIAYLNDPKFVIDSLEIDNDKNNYTYEILDMKLLLHEYLLHDSASNAIEAMLKEQKMITYPLTNVEMRSFYAAPGRFDTPECRLITSAIPKRVIMCMVDAQAYLGEHTKTPFKFDHFNIKDAFLDCGGRTIPSRPLNLDFEKDRYMPAYLAMLEGTGLARSAANNGITRELYKNGRAFFCFEISPYLDSDNFDLINLGTTSFNIRFNSAVPSTGLYVLLYSEFDSVLTIDENRNAHVDAVM